MEKESSGLILFMDIIILIVFLSIAKMAFNLTGSQELSHLAIVFVLMFFAFVSLLTCYNKSKAGWNVLLFIFILSIIEMFWLYFLHRVHFLLFILLTIVALIGFFVTVVKASAEEYDDEEFDFEEIEPEKVAPEELNVEEIEPDHSVVYKSSQPSKFVASRSGTTFHAPKCDWAKRIKKSNRVWFESEKEAKKEGYKKHDCVE